MSNKCSYEGCEEPIYPGKDKCIFHAEKETEQEIHDFRNEFGNRWGSTEFTKPADFGGFIFPPDRDFHKKKFHEAANFSKSHFRGKVNFSDTEFRGSADFTDAVFEREADFSRVRFHQYGNFHRTIFGSEVKFIWPGFGYPPGYPAGDPINFGTIRFEDIKCEHGGILDFSNNDLREGCRVIFDQCDLSRTRLVRTDCTKIEFIDCSLPLVKGRCIAGDEFLARFDEEGSEELRAERRKDPDWRFIGIHYNQIAKIARDRLDYPSVQHFDQGVMIIRRMQRIPKGCWLRKLWDFEWPRPKENKNKNTHWRQDHHKATQAQEEACGKSKTLLSKPSNRRRSFRFRPGRLIASPFYYFSWLAFYCYFSAYGKSAERALAFLIGTVPLFAVLYYLLFADLATIGDAFKLALAVSLLQRPAITQWHLPLGAHFMMAAQSILSMAFAALFLFALRRRFKR